MPGESPLITVTPGSQSDTPTQFRTANQTLARGVEPPQGGVLPEEIEKELQQLCQGDDEKKRRLTRLTRLHKNDQQEEAEDSSTEGEEEEICAKEQPLPTVDTQSETSSVEGYYGSRHPFKVIETDTRSTASESRSVQSRSGEGGAGAIAKQPQEVGLNLMLLYWRLEPLFLFQSRRKSSSFRLSFSPPVVPQAVSPSSNVVPDIVSRYVRSDVMFNPKSFFKCHFSIQNEAIAVGDGAISSCASSENVEPASVGGASATLESSSILGQPVRPPRRKKKDSLSQVRQALAPERFLDCDLSSSCLP